LNLTKPVRFADEIGALYDAGARVFVEMGAGSVLRQLTSQCLHGRPHVAIALSQKGQHDVSSLWHAVGQLAVAGVHVRCERLWPAFQELPTETPVPRSLSTVLIDGAGYNRPYPPKPGSAALPGPNPELAPIVSATLPVAVPPAMPPQSAPPAAAYSGSAFELIQAQIGEAQRASQAAILESLSITLKSLEAVASELSGGATPREFQIVPKPQVQTVALPSAPSTPVEPARPAPLPIKPAAFDPGAILLQIVAEKTGYPQDVLTLDVELEAGLGIDSIKRVEIFSAIQQQLPDLPEVTPAVMGQLKTLRDILAFLGQAAAPAAKPEPAASAVNMERALLEIVAEKTGYPIDILSLDVELEAGLGIDSIKRVEIFSAIQHKIADVPEFKPEDAGRLRTLRDILAFAGAAPAASRTGPLRRSEVRWIESQRCGLPFPGLFTCGKIAVFDGGSGLAQAVVDRLEKLNIPAHSASTLDGCRAAIYLGGWRAFQDAQESCRSTRRVLRSPARWRPAPSRRCCLSPFRTTPAPMAAGPPASRESPRPSPGSGPPQRSKRWTWKPARRTPSSPNCCRAERTWRSHSARMDRDWFLFSIPPKSPPAASNGLDPIRCSSPPEARAASRRLA